MISALLRRLPSLTRWRESAALTIGARRAALGPDLMPRIEQFFTSFPDFRSLDRCARELGISEAAAGAAYDRLCREGRIGAYSLGISGPPQARMLELLRQL